MAHATELTTWHEYPWRNHRHINRTTVNKLDIALARQQIISNLSLKWHSGRKIDIEPHIQFKSSFKMEHLFLLWLRRFVGRNVDEMMIEMNVAGPPARIINFEFAPKQWQILCKVHKISAKIVNSLGKTEIASCTSKTHPGATFCKSRLTSRHCNHLS